MKKVKLSKLQIKAGDAMVSFDMTLPPDKLRSQIEQFLRDQLIDEEAIPAMAEDMMSHFYMSIAQETGDVN